MYDTISVESENKPAVALCCKGFTNDARSAASGRGMPGIRIVTAPITPGSNIQSEIVTGMNTVINEIILALTKPLTLEEISPKKDMDTHQRIVFEGNITEINRYFYQRGWTDGLPILPPTEEAVNEMLSGTDLPRDHIVTKLIPRMGKATVEKIAINAVMAGALPTYMPVLIAATEALMDPKSTFGIWEVSTGSWAPCWLINGPIRHDLRINSGAGTLSPGDIANAVIGRAVGLIVKNIGGARKGVEDMGVFGNPMKYSLVIGENEEDSPWEPLHVERNFHKNDSTLTVFFPHAYNQTLAYGSSAKDILSTLIYNIEPGWLLQGMICFLLIPDHAMSLHKEGWSKKDLKNYISENATVPLYRSPTSRPSGGTSTAKKLVGNRPFNPNDPLRVIPNPNRILIFVAGGPGQFTAYLRGGGGAFECDFVTKKIQFPNNWEQLVKKYKNIAPTYISY